MRIINKYAQKTVVFSCEVFPPKPDNDISTIYDTIDELDHISPDFISVTYSPSGDTKSRTLEIAGSIKEKYQSESLMPLTCINLGKDDLQDLLKIQVVSNDFGTPFDSLLRFWVFHFGDQSQVPSREILFIHSGNCSKDRNSYIGQNGIPNH